MIIFNPVDDASGIVTRNDFDGWNAVAILRKAEQRSQVTV